jgi:hypothetical protein
MWYRTREHKEQLHTLQAGEAQPLQMMCFMRSRRADDFRMRATVNYIAQETENPLAPSPFEGLFLLILTGA